MTVVDISDISDLAWSGVELKLHGAIIGSYNQQIDGKFNLTLNGNVLVGDATSIVAFLDKLASSFKAAFGG